MTNGQSSLGAELSGNSTVFAYTLEELRLRAVARRHLDERESATWAAKRARRQKMRTLVVCAGTLLLMAIGLYFGLEHQESTVPVESAAPAGGTGTV